MTPSTPSQRIAGVILARNEAETIRPAIESLLGWTDEILVLDDGSTDGTGDVARSAGARVVRVEHIPQFDVLRNAAIEHTDAEWLFYLDADERVPPRLAKMLRGLVTGHGERFEAVAVPRRNHLIGDWVGHAAFPDHQQRLLRRGAFRWPARVHAGPEVAGHILVLPPDPELALEHHGARDLETWIQKMNRFTSMEAELLAEDGPVPSWRAMVAHFVEELRTFLDLRQSWRDGTRGFVLSFAWASYRFFQHAKSWDLRRQHGYPDPAGDPEEAPPQSVAEVLRFMAEVLERGGLPWLRPGLERAGPGPDPAAPPSGSPVPLADFTAATAESDEAEDPRHEAFRRYADATLLQFLGRAEEAERELETAIGLCAPFVLAGRPPLFLPHAHLVQALSRLALGLHDDAAASCRAALELAPGYPDPCCILAVADASSGRLDEAMGWYERALAAASDAPPGLPTDGAIGRWKAQLGMGEIHLLQGRPEQAEPLLSGAVAAADAPPAAWLELAKVRLALGRREEAGECLRQGLERHPGDASIRKALAALV